MNSNKYQIMKLYGLTAIVLSVLFVVSCKNEEDISTYEQWKMPNVLVTNKVTEIGYSTATVSVTINGFEKAQIENDVVCRYYIGELYESQYGDRTVGYYLNLLESGDHTPGDKFDIDMLTAQISGLTPNTEYCFIPYLYHKQEMKEIIGKPVTFKTLDYLPSLKITGATLIDDCHMCLKFKCGCDLSTAELGYDLNFEVYYYKDKISGDNRERHKYLRGTSDSEVADTLWVDVYNGEKLYLSVNVGIIKGDYLLDEKNVTDSIIIEPSVVADWSHVEAVQEPENTHVVFWSTASNLNDLYHMGSDKIELGYFISEGETIENFNGNKRFCAPEFVGGQMRYEQDFVRGGSIVYCPGFRYYNERTGKWKFCYGEKTYYKTNEFATVAPSASRAVDLGLSVKWSPLCVGQMTLLEDPSLFHIRDMTLDDWDQLWRLPTVEEVKELFDNCEVDYSYEKRCYVFTSKINGQTLDLGPDPHDSFGFWTSDVAKISEDGVVNAMYSFSFRNRTVDNDTNQKEYYPSFRDLSRYSNGICAICPVLK